MVARRHNDTVAEYAATLLHELLHFWIECLGGKGWTVREVPEHTFIHAVEDAVYKKLKLLKKGRRKRDAGTNRKAVKGVRKTRH